jgi:serine/threonine-protein kinase
MAPEQSRGEPVDFRADMYSLGVTLHHLVAGTPPFEGQTPATLAAQHHDAARPRFAAQRASAALEAVCDRLMAKRPEDRFGSYAELLASLDQAR